VRCEQLPSSSSRKYFRYLCFSRSWFENPFINLFYEGGREGGREGGGGNQRT
jgi:hypothetical protein